MNNIKTTIKYEVLFQDIPVEFLFIYKNVLKLEFAEKPEYELYLILLENVLRRLNHNNDKSFEFCFIKKINYFLNVKNEIQIKYNTLEAKNLLFPIEKKVVKLVKKPFLHFIQNKITMEEIRFII